MDNLSKFHSKNKLRNAILTFMVTQVATQEEKDELRNTFKSLDKDGSGTLTKEELIQGYLKVFPTKEQAEEEATRIVEQVDTNATGYIDYTEFAVAAFNTQKLLSKTKVEQAFKMFDIDDNGFITRNELQEVMGGIDIDDNMWKEIMKGNDENNDGKISLEEFRELLLRKNEEANAPAKSAEPAGAS